MSQFKKANAWMPAVSLHADSTVESIYPQPEMKVSCPAWALSAAVASHNTQRMAVSRDDEQLRAREQ